MDLDFLLIRRMKSGEEEAFDIFVRKYYQDVLAYCSYHCMDQWYAADLTQETFIRFFTALSSYRHKEKVKNYLYTIAHNLCVDHVRKARDVPVPEEALTGQKEGEEQIAAPACASEPKEKAPHKEQGAEEKSGSAADEPFAEFDTQNDENQKED